MQHRRTRESRNWNSISGLITFQAWVKFAGKIPSHVTWQSMFICLPLYLMMLSDWFLVAYLLPFLCHQNILSFSNLTIKLCWQLDAGQWPLERVQTQASCLIAWNMFLHFVTMWPWPPTIWNSLSADIRACSLYSSFMRHLKTFCFNTAFNEWLLLGHLVTARASDSMFLFIDFVRGTNCFYDYDYLWLLI